MLRIGTRLGRWLAVAALVPLSAAGPKAVAKIPTAWVAVVRTTPQGGFLIGNPAARVKLLEFGSYTCPHCARFEAEAVPVLLQTYVATGRVSYEFRGFPIHGPIDAGMTLLTMCPPTALGWRMSKALFAAQDSVIDGFKTISDAELARLNTLPDGQALVQYADAGGLDDFAAKYGVTKARFGPCITDAANNAKFEASSREAQERYQLKSTPWFVINDRPLEDASDWAALEPRLREALK